MTLWLANQDPEEFRPVVEEFISMNGGVVWMGKPFLGDCCPVTLEEKNLKSKTIRYLKIPGEPEDKILAPALRKRTVYESEKGFSVCMVKAKDWGKPLAVWGEPPEPSESIVENTPAVIISKDQKKRVVYIGSDLEASSEETYRFEDRHHHESHWYQTYVFYNLLSWSSGAYRV